MPIPARLRQSIERLSRETDATIREERHRLVREEVPAPQGWSVTFLGTGGNPTNLVGQHRGTGGFLVVAGGASLYVDPGPGAIAHVRRLGVELRNLSAVFVSHGHTDHVLSAGAIVEAMCRGMTARRGLLLAPPEVLASGAISAYHQGRLDSPWYPGGPERVVGLADGEAVSLAPAVTLVPVAARHGGQNFGFRLEAPGLSLGYTSDSRYLLSYRTWDGEERRVEPGGKVVRFAEALAVEDGLWQGLVGVDVLLVNVSFFDQHPHRHITAFGAVDLLRRTGARLGVLTHFDPSLGTPPARAEEVAALVGELAGTRVEAAADGLILDLAPWRRIGEEGRGQPVRDRGGAEG